MLLIDLSKKWCEDDVNDPSFAEDDDRFGEVVASFNQALGREVFYIPERKFLSSELKSETRAGGRTVNQFLQDGQVGLEDKRAVVLLMGQFLIHQLRHAPVVNDEGKYYRLIHSDPHVGNYVIDTQSGQPAMAVIDRHMYLRLEEQDIQVVEKLISGGNDNDFVYSFIERVMDVNEVPVEQRNAITNNIFGKLRLEYIKQRVRGKVDRFSLMRTMISSLSEVVDVPLNLRLMIRNIGAYQELCRRYGVDFESLYKQVT